VKIILSTFNKFVMKIRLVLLSSFVIFSLASFGQNTSNQFVSSDTVHENVLFEINLEENSKLEEAFVNVKKSNKILFIDIIGSLEQGQFKIQIYDPKGNQWKKDFVVDSRKDGEVFEFVHQWSVPDSIRESNQPTLIGRVGISIHRPKSGEWKVKLVPEKAIGEVRINYSFRH
jgi:hypothetical protein